MDSPNLEEHEKKYIKNIAEQDQHLSETVLFMAIEKQVTWLIENSVSLLGFGGVAPSNNKPYKPHKYAFLGKFELHYINFTLTEISMSI